MVKTVVQCDIHSRVWVFFPHHQAVNSILTLSIWKTRIRSPRLRAQACKTAPNSQV